MGLFYHKYYGETTNLREPRDPGQPSGGPQVNENLREIGRISLIGRARPTLGGPQVNENPREIGRISLIKRAQPTLGGPQVNENPREIGRTSLIKGARPALGGPQVNENLREIDRISLITGALAVNVGLRQRGWNPVSVRDPIQFVDFSKNINIFYEFALISG